MASRIEDAKPFVADAKLRLCSPLNARPLGLAKGVFDIGLMTHDLAVAANLLALEVEQWILNQEEKGWQGNKRI